MQGKQKGGGGASSAAIRDQAHGPQEGAPASGFSDAAERERPRARNRVRRPAARARSPRSKPEDPRKGRSKPAGWRGRQTFRHRIPPRAEPRGIGGDRQPAAGCRSPSRRRRRESRSPAAWRRSLPSASADRGPNSGSGRSCRHGNRRVPTSRCPCPTSRCHPPTGRCPCPTSRCHAPTSHCPCPTSRCHAPTKRCTRTERRCHVPADQRGGQPTVSARLAPEEGKGEGEDDTNPAWETDEINDGELNGFGRRALDARR